MIGTSLAIQAAQSTILVKNNPIMKLPSLSALRKSVILVGVGAALVCTTKAATIELTLPGNLSDPRIIGDVINNFSGGGAENRDALLINSLLGLGLNGTATVDGQVVTRSNNSFGALPAATTTGLVHNTGTPADNGVAGDNKFDLTLTSTYTYFVASYDGPNGGAAAFYIGNLAVGDVLRVPIAAAPNGSPAHLLIGNNFGLTGYGLVNPGTSVPDGGSTLALLGLALAGLALIRRRMAS